MNWVPANSTRIAHMRMEVFGREAKTLAIDALH